VHFTDTVYNTTNISVSFYNFNEVPQLDIGHRSMLNCSLYSNRISGHEILIFSYFVEFPSSTDTCLRPLHQAPATEQLVCVFQYSLLH